MDFDTTDLGGQPYVVNLEKLTKENTNYRTTKWTGTKLQMTLMSIDPEGEVGLEAHHGIDQFLRVEQGSGKVYMGPTQDNLTFEATVEDDFAIFIPAGTWHNIVNTGDTTLKMYSIYTPPEHAKGTIHKTYEEAIEAEAEHSN